jgi:hypothetical protein
MALIATQPMTPTAGLVPTFSAANASDTFVPDDRTYIHVLNTNAATRTITISTAQTIRGLPLTNQAITIAATTGQLILGPFPADTYANAVTGLCTVTPSATPNVTYAVIRTTVT